MIVAGLELTSTEGTPSSRSALHPSFPARYFALLALVVLPPGLQQCLCERRSAPEHPVARVNNVIGHRHNEKGPVVLDEVHLATFLDAEACPKALWECCLPFSGR